jgi:molybdopterin adenylyltransferase
MPLRFGILTVSDRSSRGERPDSSGPVIISMVEEQGGKIIQVDIVPDEIAEIQKKLSEWSDQNGIDVILTTGGTGFSPRDITPEATRGVVERMTPGIAEAMRAESLKITPHAMLSRGTAGIRGRTLIINLPGSPKAARENLAVVLPVLPHATALLQDDVNAEAGHRI